MVTIIFESHGTTLDNESHTSSGWNDAALSPLGEKQSKELSDRYKNQHIDTVYCSALQRSYRTGEIAFADRGIAIIKDARLNECNYGDLNGQASNVVELEKAKRIVTPFPNGESYEQTSARMKAFLDDVAHKHQGQTIMIIGHRATQYGLEHWINGVPLQKAIGASWKWQPGWKYILG